MPALPVFENLRRSLTAMSTSIHHQQQEEEAEERRKDIDAPTGIMKAAIVHESTAVVAGTSPADVGDSDSHVVPAVVDADGDDSSSTSSSTIPESVSSDSLESLSSTSVDKDATDVEDEDENEMKNSQQRSQQIDPPKTEKKNVRFNEQTMMYIGAVLNIEDYTDEEFRSCFLVGDDMVRIKHENYVTIDKMNNSNKSSSPSLMTSMMAAVMMMDQQHQLLTSGRQEEQFDVDDDDDDVDEIDEESDDTGDDGDDDRSQCQQKRNKKKMVLCRRGLEWKTKVGKKRRSEARTMSLHSVLDAQLCVKYDPSSYCCYDETGDEDGAQQTSSHQYYDHSQSAESFIASEYIKHTAEAVQRAYRAAVQDHEDVYGR